MPRKYRFYKRWYDYPQPPIEGLTHELRFVECVQLPGCVSDGTTSGQALANLQDAIREYVQSLIDDSLPVPAMPTYNAVSWSA